MRELKLILGGLIFFATVMVGQEKSPLVTDRPDMTESTVSVGPGFMQIESGFHYESDEVAGIKSIYRNFNSTLLRYGLVDGLEFRFGLGYSSFSMPGDTESGFEPLSFGFKYEMFEQSGIIPEMAVLNTLVPDVTGSSAFQADAWQGEILGAMAWGLGDFGLGANIGVAFDGNANGAAFPYSMALGIPVGSSIGGFVEVFGLLAEDAGPMHSGNVGLTWLLNPDFQMDAYTGFGLNDRAVDWSAGFGLSYRFAL
ncbi:transporter [Marinilabilia sp.]